MYVTKNQAEKIARKPVKLFGEKSFNKPKPVRKALTTKEIAERMKYL